MVELGHSVVFDEEQVAERRVEAVQPNLLFIRGKAGGERCYFFPLRGWQKSRLGWNEESRWGRGAARNVKEVPEGGEEGAPSPWLLSAALRAIEMQIIRYPALCWARLSAVASQLLFCFPLAGEIRAEARRFPCRLQIRFRVSVSRRLFLSFLPRDHCVAWPYLDFAAAVSPGRCGGAFPLGDRQPRGRSRPRAFAFSGFPKPCLSAGMRVVMHTRGVQMHERDLSATAVAKMTNTSC